MWLKGEQSGNYSILQNALLDCDKDAVLFKVQQIGVVCHTGQQTCFFNNPIVPEQDIVADAKIVEKIYEVIMDRIKNPSKESYVSSLTAKGEDAILQKISEEACELVLAAKGNRSEEITHEATDILFHILVLFAYKGFKLRGIFNELKHRHQVKTSQKGKSER
jgi:phosphoribosyl-ATP pyrophosphohydrolase/phosphoribosyl-AMP cyclohydrolase